MHFLAYIHCKDTNFIFDILHTQQRYTQTNGHAWTHIQCYFQFIFAFCVIHAKDTNFIFGTPQTYTCTETETHAHTCAETLAHIDTDTHRHMHTKVHKHTCKHTQTDAYLFTVYTNTHTCTHMHMWNLRKLLLQIHF